MSGKETIKILMIFICVLLSELSVMIWAGIIKECDELEKEIVQKSIGIELMESGQIDNRPFYVLDDKEEMDYRYTYQPIKGVSQGHEEYIPVSGGTAEEQQYIIDLLSYMPEKFQDQCKDYGWKVEIVKDITSNDSVKTIGRTDPKTKTVYVTMDQPFTVYHEFGHILRWNLNNIPKSVPGELKRLCCHSAYGSPYIYASEEEQIAESLYDYIWYPKEYQEQAPELYSRIQKEVDEESYTRYTINR